MVPEDNSKSPSCEERANYILSLRGAPPFNVKKTGRNIHRRQRQFNTHIYAQEERQPQVSIDLTTLRSRDRCGSLRGAPPFIVNFTAFLKFVLISVISIIHFCTNTCRFMA